LGEGRTDPRVPQNNELKHGRLWTWKLEKEKRRVKAQVENNPGRQPQFFGCEKKPRQEEFWGGVSP